MPGKTLMVQGTSSSAGKSLLVAGLCRLFARRGVRVAPFKAQNMSNNAAVCPDGSEIGRAQALQAVAAGVEATADMNPVLLKPEGNSRSQVVLMGRPWQSLPAMSYYERKQSLWAAVTASLDRLREQYDLVLIEGAGSPVELNLKRGDIVNMAVARYVRSPVLLVGDIDRGGIFAQLLGTLWLLEPEERALVRGLVVNKFRGDIELFRDGIAIIEERGGVPVLGVVPYLTDLELPEEDAVALDTPVNREVAGKKLDLAVIRLPLIANFDDFDPLAREPGVSVRYVSAVSQLGRPDAVIIPGTKSTIADLSWMQENGLAAAIVALAAGGTPVVGICGGYQMLGTHISDPEKIESPVETVPGLGLLPHETIFAGDKETHQASAEITGGPGWLAALRGERVQGYEIHMGRTLGGNHWLSVRRRGREGAEVPDGAVGEGGRVWGCYLHGFFANLSFRRAWLRSLGWTGGTGHDLPGVEEALERLATALEEALDVAAIEAMLAGS